MCGIAAIFGTTNNQTEQLKRLLGPIAHRGEKKYKNELANFGSCSLGMNRLAIVDPKRAKQPMTSSDGRYHIVFNGEIYNFRGLKKELEKLGYSFSTDSDTEVLVNGYAAWKESVLQKVNGMFAFFIYDQKRNSFFAARDPLGIKPLYWAKNSDGVIYFASEIKSLVSIKEIDEVHMFPPGTYMENGKLERFSSLDTEVNRTLTEDVAVNGLRELIDRSVEIRTQTDLPIAVYFSGGVDSGAVLATATKFHPDVTAIIIGNEHSSDRETAVRYCEEYGVKYIVGVPPTENELLKTIPEIVRVTESFEPNIIRQSAVSYIIAKTAAENGFKVVLCGEGSDEMFAGYPEFTTTDLKNIQQLIFSFLSDLHRTQLQRVDRTSMAFTTEVRVPFLDKDLVHFALQIPSEMKIQKSGARIVSKYILRKAMQDRLPAYIHTREKIVLSEGAGFRGNQKIGGLFYDAIIATVTDDEFENTKRQFPDWNLETKEEVYYFNLFRGFGYDKAQFQQKRVVVNQTATQPTT